MGIDWRWVPAPGPRRPSPSGHPVHFDNFRLNGLLANRHSLSPGGSRSTCGGLRRWPAGHDSTSLASIPPLSFDLCSTDAILLVVTQSSLDVQDLRAPAMLQSSASPQFLGEAFDDDPQMAVLPQNPFASPPPPSANQLPMPNETRFATHRTNELGSSGTRIWVNLD